ncbi:MAG: TlpA disulfide reductase family protein [Candidatus Thermoplasmatota archaeon]
MSVSILGMLSGCINSDKTTEYAENIVFTTLDGRTRSLADFAGKIVVLDLMAVNCQPCWYQMLELKKISENYSKNSVVIVSIDVWMNQETVDMINNMLDTFEQYGIVLDWIFGVDDSQGAIRTLYAPQGVPSLYLLDQKGNIYYSHVGYESYATLASKIDEKLK